MNLFEAFYFLKGLVHVVSPALKISVPANVLSHSSGNSAAEIQRLNGRLSKLKPMMEKLRISLSSPKLPEKIRLQKEYDFVFMFDTDGLTLLITEQNWPPSKKK